MTTTHVCLLVQKVGGHVYDVMIHGCGVNKNIDIWEMQRKAEGEKMRKNYTKRRDNEKAKYYVGNFR